MLDQVYLFFEALSFLIAVIQYPKLKSTPYKFFVPYLFCVVIYEIATSLGWVGINGSNLFATNIAMFVSFLFYSFFILALIRTPKLKKWIYRIIWLSVTCSAINMAFYQGFWQLDTITILIDFAILIVLACLYFYELMNYAQLQISIISLPGFWVNTGLLFFCLAEFLLFASFAFLADKKLLVFLELFAVIVNVAIGILYSCLTVSFLCFRKTSSQS
ncbi:hypothetical protein A0256_06565 [Mucilaginibacter sp. PAMC 26640]|nr:hypothetical protein A0256_06565 [Mucilaginibacter sp. PAMC 26640]